MDERTQFLLKSSKKFSHDLKMYCLVSINMYLNIKKPFNQIFDASINVHSIDACSIQYVIIISERANALNKYCVCLSVSYIFVCLTHPKFLDEFS